MENVENIIPLTMAKIAKDYKIVKFHSHISFYDKERFLSYGFSIDSQIKVIRKSMFKTTLQVEIKDCNLILRAKDAKSILVMEL